MQNRDEGRTRIGCGPVENAPLAGARAAGWSSLLLRASYRKTDDRVALAEQENSLISSCKYERASLVTYAEPRPTRNAEDSMEIAPPRNNRVTIGYPVPHYARIDPL